jgi:hypothetical protein
MNAITRGDSKTYKFKSPATINQTGGLVFCTFKSNINNTDENAAIKKCVNGTEYETTILLTPEDTDITPGKYVVDFQLSLNDGEIVYSMPAKTVEITADVTRRKTDE